MIKDVLSTDDTNPKRLIANLNDSIRQRSHIVRKIKEIKEIKDEISSLEIATNRYHDIGVRFYSNKLNTYLSRLNLAQQDVINTENHIEKLNVSLEEIKEELIKKEEKKGLS